MATEMPAPVPSQASWHVTGQMQTSDIGSNGAVQKGVRVDFLTGQGHAGTVFVPQPNYQPQQVAAMIQAQANLMDQIGSLSAGE